ncbi:cyclic nucleotide-binding domain-containing protein [Roseiconus nitratireducens]|uniref:Cyclic nucleotide-binding domain-containing protein n=1 Tax=Roseiconus nitratireducens TaxID=2605748 RepID=A0A5M6D4S2_9BACT|nr:cyclic nucleotide-binding and patatin-like phospholipase domain-containing protein [Roseiconus nitratireducens]KAA5540195.1 cyclic nucleotide-binding domain-containing protein [Roseiconus nitratireducens]
MDRDESVTRSLLMGLSDEGLQEILSAFVPRSYEAGSTIIQAGDPGDELFLLAAGKVRVWSGEGPAVAERTLSVMGPGEHFGEASVISGGPRTATVTAVTYVETLVLSGEDYRRLVHAYPQLLQNLSRSLTKRLSNMNVSAALAPERKRGVHSLAIIVDHPCGWPLAEQLVAELRLERELVQPILVADSDLMIPPREFDRDALSVSAADLAYTVAERSQRALTVAIASGPAASAAAIKESNRVIFAAEAVLGLSPHAAQQLDSIASHRRPLVALMFHGETSPRPAMQMDEHLTVRCRYEGSDVQARFDHACVTRLHRSLVGKRIGLALGGGGARGIAHIGVLEVLGRNDVVFDSIAGTSAGAIVAAAYGAGFQPAQVGEFFRREMIPPPMMRSRPAMRRMFLLHSFRGGRFESKLRRYLGAMSFEQADLPLAITTLDLISGEQQIRRSGDLVQSVLQSINHPVFGRPIVHDGQLLVDGGVLMNVPASVLRREGCDHVISIDVGSTISTNYAKDRYGKLRRPSYLSTLLRTMDISRRHSSALHREDSDLIIIPQTSDFRIEDFHAVDPLIEAGRLAGEQAVEDVKRVIANLKPTTDIA